MTFDDLVKEISDACPQINNFALRDSIRDVVDKSHEFPAMIYREAVKIIPADLEYLNYEILGPELQAKYEMESRTAKPKKKICSMTVSHLRLVKYNIRFQDKIVESIMSVPYLVDGLLHIKDKRSVINKVLLEKAFSRISDKDKDGIQYSPVRATIPFNRKNPFKISSYTSLNTYNDFIVTAKLFHADLTGKCGDTTIVHYMLAKFGMVEALRRMGISPNDVFFVDKVDKSDIEEFEYFAAKPFDAGAGDEPELFLKVKKHALKDDGTLRFVVNLLSILIHFRIQSIDNVYVQEIDGVSLWRVILGYTLNADRSMSKANSYAETNLKSVDHFIDPLTQGRLKEFGIIVDDTYDLLVHTFINIDRDMVNHQVQDLFNYRLDVRNGILVESFAKRIHTGVYALSKRTNIQLREVTATFKGSPKLFSTASSRKDDDQFIVPQEIVGGNLLLGNGLSKIRVGGRPDHRLHPSWAVVESVSAFSGKVVNKAGFINPFVPVDPNSKYGAIVRPAYAEDVEALIEFLPR